jgi:hypothetical protein
MSHTPSNRPCIGPILVLAAALNATAMAYAAGPINEDSFNRCRAISDDRARLLCFENLTSPPPQKAPSPLADMPDGAENTPDIPLGAISGSQGPSSIPVAGKWRLVRIPDPRAERKGKDVVSLMAPAELSGSDIDFAGLSIRCAGRDFKILIFLISPLQPQARPTIAVNGKQFQGSVVAPGTAILLPKEASDLTRQQWRTFPNLSIEVEEAGTKTRGLVSLEGFDTALQRLMETCITQ